jgi:hypothetical protein
MTRRHKESEHMQLDRFRAPALAATAVLVISGAGIAFAAGPKPAVSQPAAPAVAPADVEPVGPDTDTLEQGDQTTPDVLAPSAPGAVTAPAARPALKVDAKAPVKETAAETGPEPAETSTETEADSDGPGGHEDPPGENTDHQFEGEE